MGWEAWWRERHDREEGERECVVEKEASGEKASRRHDGDGGRDAWSQPRWLMALR
jgi:hypothetical protein